GPEASGTLPQKRKQPKSKKTPSETKATPPKTTECSEQSHSVSSGTIPYSQDLERNIQIVGMGLPFTLDEGTRKSQPLPEDKTTPFPKGLHRDKDSEESKPPIDTKPQTNPVADLLEDTQVDEEEHQSLSPNKDKPKPSHILATQVSDSDSSSLDLKKYDNILPFTKRQLVKYLRKASIEGYYEENVDHREQTNKVIDATIKSLDKNNIARGDLLNSLNGVTETLKAIPDAIKAEIRTDVSSLKQDTSKIKSMMTEIYQDFKGQFTPSSSVPEPTFAITKEKANEGEKLKKAQDVELKVVNKERSEKLRKSLTLRKHKFKNYMWTISNKLKLKKITDVKIHPHTKPVVVTVYRVKDLMNSLSRRYESIKKIPEELGTQSAHPAPVPKQTPS
nr:hypothetical protein [Tanacetum cinerariifolium]